jgi:hypothetical protein
MTTPPGPRASLRDDLAQGSVPYADEARIGTGGMASVNRATLRHDGSSVPRGHRSGAHRREES